MPTGTNIPLAEADDSISEDAAVDLSKLPLLFDERRPIPPLAIDAEWPLPAAAAAGYRPDLVIWSLDIHLGSAKANEPPCAAWLWLDLSASASWRGLSDILPATATANRLSLLMNTEPNDFFLAQSLASALGGVLTGGFIRRLNPAPLPENHDHHDMARSMVFDWWRKALNSPFSESWLRATAADSQEPTVLLCSSKIDFSTINNPSSDLNLSFPDDRTLPQSAEAFSRQMARLARSVFGEHSVLRRFSSLDFSLHAPGADPVNELRALAQSRELALAAQTPAGSSARPSRPPRSL